MTGKYSLNPEPYKCYSACTTPNVNDTLNPYDSNTDLCLSVEVARLFGNDKLTFTSKYFNWVYASFAFLVTL